MRNKLIKTSCEGTGKIPPGTYVAISAKINNMSGLWFLLLLGLIDQRRVLVLSSLFPYEQKLSVVNAKLSRYSEYLPEIKSKEEILIQAGFRRFLIRPIFSENIESRQKSRYQKYFLPHSTAVASFIGPIMLTPTPVIAMKLSSIPYSLKIESKIELIASGAVLDNDPSRRIIKRVILTGHPFKIHKKVVIVRHMFFNAGKY